MEGVSEAAKAHADQAKDQEAIDQRLLHICLLGDVPTGASLAYCLPRDHGRRQGWGHTNANGSRGGGGAWLTERGGERLLLPALQCTQGPPCLPRARGGCVCVGEDAAAGGAFGCGCASAVGQTVRGGGGPARARFSQPRRCACARGRTPTPAAISAPPRRRAPHLSHSASVAPPGRWPRRGRCAAEADRCTHFTHAGGALGARHARACARARVRMRARWPAGCSLTLAAARALKRSMLPRRFLPLGARLSHSLAARHPRDRPTGRPAGRPRRAALRCAALRCACAHPRARPPPLRALLADPAACRWGDWSYGHCK